MTKRTKGFEASELSHGETSLQRIEVQHEMLIKACDERIEDVLAAWKMDGRPAAVFLSPPISNERFYELAEDHSAAPGTYTLNPETFGKELTNRTPELKTVGSGKELVAERIATTVRTFGTDYDFPGIEYVPILRERLKGAPHSPHVLLGSLITTRGGYKVVPIVQWEEEKRQLRWTYYSLDKLTSEPWTVVLLKKP